MAEEISGSSHQIPPVWAVSASPTLMGLSAWTYSLVYNASYMLPETLITVVGAVLLIKAAPQIFDRQYTKA